MSKLAEDLDLYYNEAYYRRDIKAGIKLIKEITGLVSLGAVLVSALFIWLPGIGIPVTAVAAGHVIKAAVTAYADLDATQRKQVRGVVKFVQGRANLLD